MGQYRDFSLACHLAFHRHCVDHRAPCRGSGAKSSSYVGSPPAAQVIRNSRDLEDAERFFSAKVIELFIIQSTFFSPLDCRASGTE